GELENKEEELAKKTKGLKKEELISTQLKHELRDEKAKVRVVYRNMDSITISIMLKHPNLTPPAQKYGSSLECLEDLT
ncbi:hypothetical protein KI387_027086, partial [Taxus chinensis]